MTARGGVSEPSPSILRMSAPLVISFWMRAAFTLVDTVYAATIGDAAVAAIGLTAPFEFLMIALWVGLSTGLTSALSRSMGAREGDRIEQYRKASWRMALVMSPLFALIGAGIWFASPSLGLGADVSRSFQIYGTVLIGGSAFTAFWSVIPDSLVKAHHDTRAMMWAGIWSNVINVTLNTVFVFVFHWGVFGIALSTVLGRIGGLWYALVRAARHERKRKATWTDPVPGLDASPYRTILALAVPSSLTFVLMAVETGLINGLLATLEHATEAIAAYSIYYRVVLFAFNPVIAAAVAMLPYAARRFGEDDVQGVRRGFREALVASAAYCLLLVGPVMLLWAPQLAAWLAESPVTQRYATFALRLVPLTCLTGAPLLLCRPVFEGMQRGNPGLAMAFLRYVVLAAPLAWLGILAGRQTGQPELYGVLIGLLAAAAIVSVVFWIWLNRALACYGGCPEAEVPEPESPPPV